MAVLELLPVAVSLLAILLLLAVLAAHDLARQLEPLAAVAGRPALLALRALPLLRAGCLGKAAVVAVVVLLAQVELAVQVVAALVVAAAVQHAVHTPLALVA